MIRLGYTPHTHNWGVGLGYLVELGYEKILGGRTGVGLGYNFSPPKINNPHAGHRVAAPTPALETATATVEIIKTII